MLFMLSKSSVFLIGPMGSGKTAVGRQLARALRYAFFDSDIEVERQTGVDIPFIFEKEGENGFRQREREMIEELTRREPIVLATGGGAILNAENRRFLNERGCVIYLQTSVRQQLERTRRARGRRPLLLNTDPKARLQELMTQREPLYVATADLTVATDGRRVKEVAADILRLLKDRENPQNA